MKLRYVITIACIAVAAAAGSQIAQRSASTASDSSRVVPPQVAHEHSVTTDDVNGCEAGCSISNHPIEPLTSGEYFELLDAFASDDPATHLDAFEKLVFHGGQVRSTIEATGTPTLGSAHAALLARELAKTHVRLYMRLVDDQGVVRALIDGASFPVGEKTHVHMATRNLQPLEASGTIHRTGLNHLWTRM